MAGQELDGDVAAKQVSLVLACLLCLQRGMKKIAIQKDLERFSVAMVNLEEIHCPPRVLLLLTPHGGRCSFRASGLVCAVR